MINKDIKEGYKPEPSGNPEGSNNLNPNELYKRSR